MRVVEQEGGILIKRKSNYRVKEVSREVQKYIIRSYSPFLEKRTDSLFKALRIRKQMKRDSDYCHIVKVPFRKRHPWFPLGFSIVALLIVIAA